MSHLSQLPPAPKDPIFTIAEEAKLAGPGKIDASIGILVGEDGKPFVFECVAKAMKALANDASGAAPYPPLLGIPEFRKSAAKLILGDDATCASIATTGGTGAVTINLLLAKQMKIKNVLLPVPSWVNHRRIVEGIGMSVSEVPYMSDGKATIDPVIEALKKTSDPHVLLLQGTSHNPTGKSWSLDEWKALGMALGNSKHIALLDLPYQGLALGIREDMQPVKILKEAGATVLVAWSASKNHGIYGLRTGLALALTTSKEEQENIEGWYRILTRQMHSAASITGQHTVAYVQTHLADEWKKEIDVVRANLDERRTMLQEALPEWREVIAGDGLYTMLPFSEDQLLKLKQQEVFLAPGGRVNIGGLPKRDVHRFIERIQNL